LGAQPQHLAGVARAALPWHGVSLRLNRATRAGFVDGSWLTALVRGYNWVTVLVVANLAFSGLLVSWVMKFADSIMKARGPRARQHPPRPRRALAVVLRPVRVRAQYSLAVRSVRRKAALRRHGANALRVLSSLGALCMPSRTGRRPVSGL